MPLIMIYGCEVTTKSVVLSSTRDSHFLPLCVKSLNISSLIQVTLLNLRSRRSLLPRRGRVSLMTTISHRKNTEQLRYYTECCPPSEIKQTGQPPHELLSPIFFQRGFCKVDPLLSVALITTTNISYMTTYPIPNDPHSKIV